ncbi:MAG: hypothetical protein OEY11_03725 [Gammaproteobacteria bacterium]|nr:hypothetical protein [Gammaproteobacteria bacterium]
MQFSYGQVRANIQQKKTYRSATYLPLSGVMQSGDVSCFLYHEQAMDVSKKADNE